MKKLFAILIILAVLLFSSTVLSAPTKEQAAVDEWAAIAPNTVREGATTDISDCYMAVLHIEMAITSETAHTGSLIFVQVSSSEIGSETNEDWTNLARMLGPTGTANSEALAGAEAQGQTVLEVADTTGYDAAETRWIIILDDTVADSEMCLLVSHEGTPSVTVQDGITNAHTAADTLYNIASTYTIIIPIEFNRVRIIYDNTLDSDGSQVHTKSRISKVTAL